MNLNKYTEARRAVRLKHYQVAAELGLTRQALYERIKNDTLTIADIRVLMKLLHRPLTWFFSKE